LGALADGGRAGPLLGAAVLALALSAAGALRTAASTSFVFTAVGDYGSTASTTDTLRAIGRSGAALHLALGDLSYDTNPESAWCDYVKANVGAAFPFELISGNHEMDGGGNGRIDNFAACLPDRLGGVVGTYGKQYYVDYQGLARFILISPNLKLDGAVYAYTPGSARYAWLSGAIDDARAKNIPWVIVGMHEPCLGVNDQFACYQGGGYLVDLLASKRVDLVLHGHAHTYERSKQLATGPSCGSVPVGAYNAGCVADDGSDNAYPKGAGAVFVTVGTAGHSLGRISTTDPEAGDFVRWMGSNSTPKFGFLQVAVSASELAAQFVETSYYCNYGCKYTSFTDGFRIVAAGAPSATPTPTPPAVTPTGTPSPTSTPPPSSATPTPTPAAPSGTATPAPTQTPTPTTTPFAAPATLTLGPVADAYVEDLNPGTNYGPATRLKVDAYPVDVSYLKFDLGPLAGRTIASATLRVKVATDTGAASASTQNVRVVDDSSWSEGGLTYANRPAVGATVVGSLANTAAGAWYDVALAPAAVQPRAGGLLSLAVDSPGSDGLVLYARESAYAPQLILTYR
jgi:hypothetical protein